MQGGVKTCQGFIEKQKSRTKNERSGERNTPSFAARQCRDVTSLITTQPDEGQHVLDLFASSPGIDSGGTQSIRHVLLHVEMRKELAILEDHAELTTVWRQSANIVTVEPDETALDALEPGDDAEKCRLAATAWTGDSDNLASIDCQRERFEDWLTIDAHRNVLNFKHERPPRRRIRP
jgi:hypothetical protein